MLFLLLLTIAGCAEEKETALQSKPVSSANVVKEEKELIEIDPYGKYLFVLSDESSFMDVITDAFPNVEFCFENKNMLDYDMKNGPQNLVHYLLLILLPLLNRMYHSEILLKLFSSYFTS